MTATGVLRKVAKARSHGRRRVLGLALAVVPLLASCLGATVPPNAAAPEARLTAAVSRTSATPLPKVKPSPPMVASPLPMQTASLPDIPPPTAPAATPEPTRSAPLATPDTLVGLNEAQTAKLLGSPAAREEASPGRIWRYAKGGCRLDVFFFMDMTLSQDFRALSYDMKSNPNVPDSDRQCFAQLLAQSGSPAGSEPRAVRND
ncbi:hypothetical protein [Azospirillum cavernae]|uniref:hypothetical protein n=1 Tax=Azospirillum cavernae TaxID=2320860 RepID=UPI001EE5E140|nr:hypothetical protein [Azospirillum cavernae]